jgi:deoxyribonuclease V
LSWPDSESALVHQQHRLARQDPDRWSAPDGPLAIGACVVVFARLQRGLGARGDRGWAAAAVLRGARVLASSGLDCRAGGPYVPGLLAMREGPCLEAAVRALPEPPEVLLVDATGCDHPRRAGLALHLGAVVGQPTVGVTHRPLIARGDWPPDDRGARAPLRVGDEVVGMWLRTRSGARPVAVHAGWRTDLDTAVRVVLRATSGHRTPEPFRAARRLARVRRAEAEP